MTITSSYYCQLYAIDAFGEQAHTSKNHPSLSLVHVQDEQIVKVGVCDGCDSYWPTTAIPTTVPKFIAAWQHA